MRLLVVIAIVYLAYRALKIWFRKNIVETPLSSGGPGKEIDDTMIKDPVCGMYFPKMSGTSAVVDGKTVYFCGEKCREKYLAERSAKEENDTED